MTTCEASPSCRTFASIMIVREASSQPRSGEKPPTLILLCSAQLALIIQRFAQWGPNPEICNEYNPFPASALCCSENECWISKVYQRRDRKG